MLRESRRHIWEAWTGRTSAYGFKIDLEKRGMHVARVTEDDHEYSRTENWAAKRAGKYSPVLDLNETVIVDRWGSTYRLTPKTTGTADHQIREFVKPFENDKHIPSLRTVRAQVEVERVALREAQRDRISTRKLKRGAVNGLYGAGYKAERVVQTANRGVDLAGSVVGTAAKTITRSLESLLAKKLTPEQKLDGKVADEERRLAAERASRQREDSGRER
jgi:hypothetical protein